MAQENEWAPFAGAFTSFVIEESPLSVCLLSPEGTLLQWNAAFASLLSPQTPTLETALEHWVKQPYLHHIEHLLHNETNGTWKSARIYIAPTANIAHEFICRGCKLEHQLLLILERVSTEHIALQTISSLNADLTQLTRQLASSNRKLEQTNTLITELMNTDTLTGIPNRRAFTRESKQAYSLAVRRKLDATFLMFDLDHFKSINDQFGHDAGDEVLRQFAQMLITQSRLEDLVARWGGEEFVALLPMTRQEDALVLVSRILASTQTLQFERYPSSITVSIGVAQLEHHESMEGWFKRADEAMYQAKAQGRNGYCIAP